ncbi:MAG: restriction endonuclease subunit R, partial [Phycisphaerales bacterium]
MVKKKSQAHASELKFYQRLVLNQYLLSLFGVSKLEDLAKTLNKPALELVDNEGVSEFYKCIVREFGDGLKIDSARLLAYDLNIICHTRRINEKRDEKITLKYFQYLSLLFVEYYLDCYFNDRKGLLTEL